MFNFIYEIKKISLLGILSLVFVSFSFLHASALFKYNESDNTHVLDKPLIVESVEAASVNASGTLEASGLLKGSGSNISFSAGSANGGWEKVASSVRLKNSGDTVKFGANTTGAKLSVDGNLHVNKDLSQSKPSQLIIDKNPAGAPQFYVGEDPGNALTFGASGERTVLTTHQASNVFIGTEINGSPSHGNAVEWFTGKNNQSGGTRLMSVNHARMVVGGDNIRIPPFLSPYRLIVRGTLKASGFVGDGSGISSLQNIQQPSSSPKIQCRSVGYSVGTCPSGGGACVCRTNETCVSAFAQFPAGAPGTGPRVTCDFNAGVSGTALCCDVVAGP